MTDRNEPGIEDRSKGRFLDLHRHLPSTAFVVLLSLALAAFGGAFVYAGVYNIGADAPHSTMVYNTLDMFRERAIAHHARNIVVPADFNDPAAPRQLWQQALDALDGRIDGLINNAAYFREVKLTDFEQIDPVVWDRIFAVNVKGLWHCCKSVMPMMRRQGSGAILNISSVVAVAGQPGYLHYVATKGAVLAMTKGLAKEIQNRAKQIKTQILNGFRLFGRAIGAKL